MGKTPLGPPSLWRGCGPIQLNESGEGMVSIREAVDGLKVEFSGTLINDRHPRVFFLRSGLRESGAARGTGDDTSAVGS